MNSRPRSAPDEPTSKLEERIKELGCLYEISQIIVDEGVAREERLRRIVSAIPRAWYFPESAFARITLDGKTHESAGSGDAGVTHHAELIVDGVRRGLVEVGYQASFVGDRSTPFLPEEERLLANVARQISLYLAREEGAARRAILEEQLRHADRLATIGQLAAGVAHEMNEPLSSVLGLAQLSIKAPAVPPTVADDLREIVAAALRAREIVKKLLLFARQTPPRKTRLNLNEIVEDALFLLEAGSEKPGVRLIRTLASDLPRVEADSLQLRQVVVNLTVNAMQAIESDGTVSVETSSDGRYVVLSITDTGDGMSPETLGQIFNPFFTTKDVGVGTGLGLAVVHGIVTAHEGTIEVESAQGKGSRFAVRLPVVADSPAVA
ncbi:MAG: hypothetical protein AMXMBFR47_35960 [Planctomycetota bacterium]